MAPLGLGSTNNIPPARSANIAWGDNNGNFWLAGGEQISTSTYYNDVWEFNPQTLEWTWVAGPQGSSSAVSSGNGKSAAQYARQTMGKSCNF